MVKRKKTDLQRGRELIQKYFKNEYDIEVVIEVRAYTTRLERDARTGWLENIQQPITPGTADAIAAHNNIPAHNVEHKMFRIRGDMIDSGCAHIYCNEDFWADQIVLHYSAKKTAEELNTSVHEGEVLYE